MKQIIKSKEPKSLTNYRASITKTDLKSLKKYEDSPKNVLDDLRKALLEEQGYICCYCMQRVDFRYTKIEHFKSRSGFREKQLDYNNLFISCLGGEGSSPTKQFCDTKKGDRELNYINLLTDIESKIEYKKDGYIYSNDDDINNELNDILNLNYLVSKNNRKETLRSLYSEFKKIGWSNHSLKENIKKYQNKNSKGKYRPYCQMIVYFLTKKLKQKGVTI